MQDKKELISWAILAGATASHRGFLSSFCCTDIETTAARALQAGKVRYDEEGMRARGEADEDGLRASRDAGKTN